jgi:hypothetical protein
VILLLYHHCIWDLSLIWSCPSSRRVIHQQKYLIEDQVAPELFLGSYPPRLETKDQPMPYAWVPWTFPGALGLSRDFSYLVLDQEPQSYTGGPLRGLYCLVLHQEPQSYTRGPSQGSFPPWYKTMDQPMPQAWVP